MNILLDTHTFLWFVNDDPALSNTALRLIEDSKNQVFLSIASVWEMAIKVSVGRLTMPSPFDSFIIQQLSYNQIQLLNISLFHMATMTKLTFYHDEPFDRMIAAQALVEHIPLLSHNEAFDSYRVKRLW